jgi:hypothetical protein
LGNLFQIFFEDDLNTEVFATSPYSENTNTYMTDEEVRTDGMIEG